MNYPSPGKLSLEKSDASFLFTPEYKGYEVSTKLVSKKSRQRRPGLFTSNSQRLDGSWEDVWRLDGTSESTIQRERRRRSFNKILVYAMVFVAVIVLGAILSGRRGRRRR